MFQDKLVRAINFIGDDKVKGKKISSLFLLMFLFFSVSSASYAENVSQIIGDNNTVVFVDVTEDYEWAKDAINYFAKQGIVQGVSDGKFAPEELVTREQFTKMLVLTFNAPLTSPTEPTFADVPKDKWSYPYIEVSKDFLTGYANPFGGKMNFHPEEAATREDIAVSLIRMMGLTDKDAKDPNYALRAFKDAGDISPGLLKYVSAAAERGLINGFEDGTFRPTKSITRAESVVLLNRATKQSVSSATEELGVSAAIIPGQNPAEVTLSVKAEEGTKITVDGQDVMMDDMGNGYLGGMVPYKFEQEGNKTFKVEAVKGSKRKTLDVEATYKIGVPTLTINPVAERTATDTITITGSATDTNDSYPKIYMKGEYVSTSTFSETVKLSEGENVFTFKAVNNLNKESETITKTIVFDVGGPKLTINPVSERTTKDTVTITGSATDTNDSYPKIYMNGEYVSTSSFSETVKLSEGENVFTFKAVNNLNKESETITKTIVFDVGGPKLTVNPVSERTTKDTITITGSATDTNDSYPKIYINGEYVSTSSFSKTVKLSEGENVFTFKAVNNLNKESETITKTITYETAAPQIVITNSPAETNQKNLSLQGNVKPNDGTVKLYVNDQEVSISSNGTFSKNVTLSQGDNTFVFRVVNSTGKSASVEKTIKYTESLETTKNTDTGSNAINSDKLK